MSAPDSPSRPYPWQLDAWAACDRDWRAGRLPHALLIHGSPDIGKRQFAQALAHRLLCAEPGADGACGRCKQCLLLAHGNHPDLTVVAPAEAGKMILVDSIRALADAATQTAQQGGWKVMLIDPAEAMNANSANALLKTLEEPSARTMLMLVSHQPALVLATVRSRCRQLRFPLPAPALVLPWLAARCGEVEPAQLLRRANGRPLRALALANTGVLSQLTQFEQLLDAVANGDASALAAAERCHKDPAAPLLDGLEAHLHQRLRATALGGGTPERRAFWFVDRLQDARRRLLASPNLNRQLLWEELLLDWRRLHEAARL